jgi:hypothetical protein
MDQEVRQCGTCGKETKFVLIDTGIPGDRSSRKCCICGTAQIEVPLNIWKSMDCLYSPSDWRQIKRPPVYFDREMAKLEEDKKP